LNRKTIIGLVGTIAGGIWLADTWDGFAQEGVIAVGVPAIVTLLGLNTLVKGLRGER